MSRTRIIIPVGTRFGRLVVVGDGKMTTKEGWKKSSFLCVCDCGNQIDVASGSLRRGVSNSCGCLQKELLVSRITKHGMTRTREFNGWMIMKARCTNVNHPRYYRYGGRGITVCDRWLESFDNFYEDMGDKPRGMSLERIDNDGNYCKENCKWATNREQANNRRNNKYYLYNGVAKNLVEWSLEVGLDYLVIYKRLRRGWSIKDSLTKELQTR